MTNHDFILAWEHADSPDGPWAHLQVVRFTGREELSALYRYELTLLAKMPAPEVDPHALIGARATLRIATLTRPELKLVHGVITEAEEHDRLPDGMLYRAVLMPPLVRAQHRTRCRVFLEKTTRQIVEAVLLGDPRLMLGDGVTVDEDDGHSPSFTPAMEKLCWRIANTSRLDDVRVRPYCVQYNESDLAFVSRLLEEEGISYHVENGAHVCLLVLSDTDQGKTRLDPFEPLGKGFEGRHVSSLKLGARLRETAVRLTDYDWRKPALDLTAGPTDANDLFEHRFPGRYSDAPSQGEPLARACLDRYRTEAAYATAESTCRMLSAGSVLKLDHPEGRYDGEYLITKLLVRGEQPGVTSLPSATESALPFMSSFECARRGQADAVQESRFRPARVAPKPRILGSQTAFVTAEPSASGAEIHVGGPEGAEIGCVRLKFHWDQERARLAKEPSSCWVRVSQLFAGAGEGAVWHPRVGTEVVVEFLDGDPDRPLVTGRVYNGANRPPASGSGSPTVSIFKSMSSPGGGTFNELSFDDAAGKEHVKLHAGRDYSTTVGHDRAERVTNNSTSSVQVDRTESTGSNRSTTVTGNNTEAVSGNESLSVSGNRSASIAGNQSTSVGVDQSVSVGVNRTVGVGSNESIVIGANRSISIAGNRSETVSGNGEQTILGNKEIAVSGSSKEGVSGDRTVTVAGAMTHSVSGAVTLSADADKTETVGANLTVSAGANATVQAKANLALLASAEAVLQGATIHVTASGEIILSAGGSAIKISGAGVEISGGAVKIAGGSVDIKGGIVTVN
jgi:type VI secretion system secreted protein VgrG